MLTDLGYLQKLQNYYARHRVMPSFAAAGRLLGLRSKSSVAALASRLRSAGYLETAPGGRLAPGPRFFMRARAEGVRAGLPSPVEEDLRDAISIDEYLVTNPADTVLVEVKGDSMVDDGIYPGDLTVVEKRPDAKVGDLVVAIMDGDFTLKRLAQEKGRPVLLAANPAYSPIRAKGQFEIFGVVVGLIRKYRR
jgi:repressor LexA